MRVKVLGAAAGGAFPQWNCACSNCKQLRQGTFHGKARTQAQIAFSPEGAHWFLLNASPDLRIQIEATPELHPRQGSRDTPIAAIVLTCAELDQVLGLLLLRESQPLHVYCTESVRRILMEDNSMFRVLERIPDQVRWTTIRPGVRFEMSSLAGDSLGLSCDPFVIPSGYPGYAKEKSELHPDEAVLGLVVSSARGGRFAYFPGTPAIRREWREAFNQCDALFLDGTFWSSDELQRVQGFGSTAEQMGHMPLSGPHGSLETLKDLSTPRKVYFHLNNTNPVLDESGKEYAMVREQGWDVAYDGMEFSL
jgi:pyrroloquinoline quinone biosynthesis protein B